MSDMNKFTFVCENAGSPKLKKLTLEQIARGMRRPRLLFVDDGVRLEAELAYRQGDWMLSSPGGLFHTFNRDALPLLVKMMHQMGQQ